MHKFSVLSLRKLKRTGYPCDFDYADFLIDGSSLFERLQQEHPVLDWIGCLGWGRDRVQRDQIDRLLLIEEADLPRGRRSLYVCPACGDLGCGSIAVSIEKENGAFVWRDFGIHGDDYASEPQTRLEGIGPFYFEAEAYEQTIRSAYGLGGFHWPKRKVENGEEEQA